ncbi:MAG: TSUP family transporter [Gammaproteobacteria bacterium]
MDFSWLQLGLIGLIFLWTGFVRSGLGFGGAALGLPLMLFILPEPVFWLPVIGLHLLFFTTLTLRTRLDTVDWPYLLTACVLILPAALAGIFGLLNFPNRWLLIFIYSITLFYAVLWVLNRSIHSSNPWLDKALLVLGGYVAGTSLTGAPLMVAVFMRNVAANQLRNTLFVLWFILVSMKMLAFKAMNVELHALFSLYLLPIAAIGHIIGLKAHEAILDNDRLFKRIIGGVLVVISCLGLFSVTLNQSV